MEAATEYRLLLKREFESRSRRNGSYSLRAFARQLEISSSRLSEILGGKQGLSSKWAGRIAERLGLSEQEKQRFCDLAEVAHGKSALKRRLAEIRLTQQLDAPRRLLAKDTFEVISDWHHFAITELAVTEGFNSEPTSISRRLGIPRKAVELAIDRLLRVGLMIRTPDGRLQADPEATTTTDGVPSEAIRKFHSQVLERASRAIYTQTVSQRDLSALMLPIDSARIPEAKIVIREFRRSFSKALAPMRSKDSVYCLAIQFFRVDETQ